MSVDDQIVKIVREQLASVEAIYVFGSSGTNDERPDSDLDIAVYGTVDPKIMEKCRLSLESAFLKDVHLIDIRSASTILQKEIVTKGRLLWTLSASEMERFALFIFASYQKLSAERKAIIESGLESGRFYQP